MADRKPVTVYRSDLTDRWYAAIESKPLSGGKPGSHVATSKADVANGEELEAMWDARMWLAALMAATKKTREQIAADYHLDITMRGARLPEVRSVR